MNGCKNGGHFPFPLFPPRRETKMTPGGENICFCHKRGTWFWAGWEGKGSLHGHKARDAASWFHPSSQKTGRHAMMGGCCPIKVDFMMKLVSKFPCGSVLQSYLISSPSLQQCRSFNPTYLIWNSFIIRQQNSIRPKDLSSWNWRVIHFLVLINLLRSSSRLNEGINHCKLISTMSDQKLISWINPVGSVQYKLHWLKLKPTWSPLFWTERSSIPSLSRTARFCQ